MHLVRRNVDLVEQMLLDPPPMALQLVRLNTVEPVEHESHDVRKIEPFLAMQPRQLAIHADRRAACRQPEHRLLTLRTPLTDDSRNRLSHMPRQVVARLKNIGG